MFPRALIEQQKEAIQKDITNNLKQQGFNDDMVKSYFEKWSDDLEEKGLFQVRSGLILDKLARDYEIESDESDLDKKLDELAAQSGMEKDQLANYYNGNETLKRNCST
jgi:trigger factor